MKLEPGADAPPFALLNQDDEQVTLDDFTGRHLVVYFYPKAFTPGCTGESCDFRDRHERFLAAGYDVIGVSPDSPKRLADFRAEYGLPFDLLSDPDHDMATAYGAWGIKKNYGREYEGLIRSTLIIDPEGKVATTWYNVRAKEHAARVERAILS